MKRMAALEREIRGQTVCLAIIVGFLVVSSFSLLKPVLLPFVLALFIVMGLNPLLAGIQTRFSTTRLVALAIAAIIGFVLVFVLWSIIWLSMLQLQENSAQYATRFKQLADYVQENVNMVYRFVPGLSEPDPEPGAETSVTPSVDRSRDSNAPPAEDAPPAPPPTDDDNLLENPLDENLLRNPLLPPPPDVTAPDDEVHETERNGSRDAMSQIVNRGAQLFIYYLSITMIEIMNSGTMVVIFVFFLLLGSSEAAPHTSDTWQEIDRSVREYIVSKTLISFFTGLAFGFSLWLFGIPLAMVFALLAFLFNFIPNIGPIIASLLPVPLILLDPELSIWGMIGAIGLSSAVQVISGNVIEPRMMGDSFDLHPIAILLTLIFWGMIWGIIGMFLATPITAIMKILFAKFEMTRPLADLLAGRLDAVKEKYAEYMGKGSDADAQAAPETTSGRDTTPGASA